MDRLVMERTGAFTRQEALEILQAKFWSGEIMVDPDDPRTTAGLTPAEVTLIRSEPYEGDSSADKDFHL